MRAITICILYLIIYSVHSKSCDISVTDIKYNKIDKSLCSKNPCIVKCCGENEVIHATRAIQTCKNIDNLEKELNLTGVPLDYSDLEILQNDIYKGRKLSTKKFQEFTLLQSEVFMNTGSKCVMTVKDDPKLSKIKLLEGGALVIYLPNHYNYWQATPTPEFCVERRIGKKNNRTVFDYIYRMKINNKEDLKTKNIYTAIAMLISAFFLLLVLIVYCALHQLRNIQGMLLTAYVATLAAFYTIKASHLIYRVIEKNEGRKSSDCTVITQIIYFLVLSSFFWLKLMSFDIWWTFRGSRKLRAIHRRGINVKFMIYASYAYGVPAAITVFAAIMDKQNLQPHIVKPFFNSCFISDTFFLYLYVPLMILTTFNCVLFIMTIYNIWLIRRNMASFDKTTVMKNKKNQNRFWLYIKLSSLMGVSWILEIIQSKIPDDNVSVWLYVLINAYNVFIGVVIFFMFVFKTSIFLMLCKRFNIENRWTRRDKVNSSSTRSELSKVSKSYSRTKSTDDMEIEERTFVQKTDEDYNINTNRRSVEFVPSGVIQSAL